jgi:galactonate dehydratase
VETFVLSNRQALVTVATSDGTVGWGEAVVENWARPTAATVERMAEFLIGRNPLEITRIWQVLTRGGFYRGGPVMASAVAGIDQALWDIAGKHRQAPVHELLGGPVRNRLRVYSWIGGDDPAEVGDHAARQRAAGFTAVKMNASGRMDKLSSSSAIDGVLARAGAVRDALGSDFDFALDFHGRFSTATARRVIGELDSLRPMFVEEPVLPEHTSRLRDVVDATTIPIACGERMFSRGDFLPALQAGIGVAQPDVSHCGGISEARRIASLAETFDVLFAPHCPLGPIALAASMQVSLATPNFLIQEQSLGIHYNDSSDLLDYLVDASVFGFVDGFCDRLTGPGLGIEVDEAAVRQAGEIGHRWRGPVWRYEDGSFAEW